MSHSRTHRQRLARRLARETSLGYQQALARVDAAAEAGLLPATLDDAGMTAALRILTTPDPDLVTLRSEGESQNLSRGEAEQRLRDLPYTAYIAEDLADLDTLAGVLREHGFVAEVLPPSPDWPGHVLTHDPRNGLMEFSLNRDYESGSADRTSVYGFGQRHTLLDDYFDDLGDLPGAITDGRTAAEAFLAWYRAADDAGGGE